MTPHRDECPDTCRACGSYAVIDLDLTYNSTTAHHCLTCGKTWPYESPS